MLDKIDQVKVDTEAQQQILIIFIPGLATKRQLLKKKKMQILGVWEWVCACVVQVFPPHMTDY